MLHAGSHIKFPAPLEVDRFLYKVAWKRDFELSQKFPAPLEVDRELYPIMSLNTVSLVGRFPAPLEVDRYLYDGCEHYLRISRNVSDPSRGR